MKCLDCDNMMCKQFFVKPELWTGYCGNKNSPNYGTVVTGNDGCETEGKLF
jgi:hypothetical protein